MACCLTAPSHYLNQYLLIISDLNTLRPRLNGRHFADDIFKRIFLNENIWIPIKISLKFVPKGSINHIPALVQIMAWRRPGDKPLSEPMVVRLSTHICVTRPQWVKAFLQMIHQPSITKVSLKITYLKFHSNLPGPGPMSQHIVPLKMRLLPEAVSTKWLMPYGISRPQWVN